MASSNYRPLPQGIYTPLPTFFHPNEDVDLVSFAKHVQYVAGASTVPVVAGSAGSGLSHVPIVAGMRAPSTRETIQIAYDAAAAGADYAMLLPPGYYAGQLSGPVERPALIKFFVDVAEASPLPIVLYNFLAVSGSIDLDSDLIIDVIKAAPNVVGVKLTCASVGKITRINTIVSKSEFRERYPRRHPDASFRIIDGFIDILLPSIASGAAGAISGLPNIVPQTCVRLWELPNAKPGEADYDEAQRLQGLLALADGACQKIGVAGLKMLVHITHGYSKNPRRPLLPMDQEQGVALISTEAISAVLQEEDKLKGKHITVAELK